MKLTDKFEKCAGVYILKNICNGKYYVGETVNIKHRMYYHSIGTKQVIHKAIIKYGIDNFEVYVEYLPNFSKDDLIELEEQLIKRFNSIGSNGYNLCPKGVNHTGFICTEETKKKLALASSRRVWSEESKLKISKSKLGIPRSEETKRKVSESNKGKVLSEEHKRNISNTTKGRIGKPHTEKTKTKIGNMNRGRIHTEEHKKKISEGGRGLKRSEETRKRMSAASTGRIMSKESIQKGIETRRKNRENKLTPLD